MLLFIDQYKNSFKNLINYLAYEFDFCFLGGLLSSIHKVISSCHIWDSFEHLLGWSTLPFYPAFKKTTVRIASRPNSNF